VETDLAVARRSERIVMSSVDFHGFFLVSIIWNILPPEFDNSFNGSEAH
jgi:hypothetical protein